MRKDKKNKKDNCRLIGHKKDNNPKSGFMREVIVCLRCGKIKYEMFEFSPKKVPSGINWSPTRNYWFSQRPEKTTQRKQKINNIFKLK